MEPFDGNFYACVFMKVRLQVSCKTGNENINFDY